MKEWKFVSCGDIIDVRDGTHESPKYSENGFPLVTSKNLINRALSLNEVNYISQTDFENINKRSKVDNGDILYSMIGSIGNFAIVEGEPNFAIKNVALFKFNNDVVYNKFFFHLLSSSNIKEQIENQQRGGTQQFVSLTILRNLQIPLPPLETQKKIAAILDAADAYRQKTKTLIEKYDQLAQSLFLEMFGDPVRNEKGWEMKQLRHLSTKILSGNTPKGGDKVYVDRGIIFLRSQNVWKNRLVLNDVAYIDSDTHNRMRNTSLKNRDILMTKTGRFNTENSSLGRASMFLGEDNSANINGHVYLIRLKKNIINEFVLFILTSNTYREYIRRVCVGGIDKRQINKEHLEEFPIIIPQIELQNQFADRIQLIEAQKQQAQAALHKAEDLFNSLLQRAFKGELV